MLSLLGAGGLSGVAGALGVGLPASPASLKGAVAGTLGASPDASGPVLDEQAARMEQQEAKTRTRWDVDIAGLLHAFHSGQDRQLPGPDSRAAVALATPLLAAAGLSRLLLAHPIQAQLPARAPALPLMLALAWTLTWIEACALTTAFAAAATHAPA